MIGQSSDTAPSASNRPPRILLSGRPGCGKTTVIQRSLELIGHDRCAGFYTREVREGEQRIGFDVVTLDGRRGPLARIGIAGPRVGRYGVDIRSFERLALPALAARADGSQRRILVLDEIGKMELLSMAFIELLRRLVDDPSSAILGTVLAGRHPVVDAIRCRDDIELIQVTTGNRDGLPAKIGRLFAESSA